MTKMGVQVQNTTLPGRYWAARAPVVKQLDGTDVLRLAPAGATTIFRHVWSNPSDQNVNRNGGEVAGEVIAALGGFKPTYIELFNEVGGPEHVGQGLERYAQFHSEALPVVHAAGIKLMGYSFTTGQPQQADWQYLPSVGFGGVDAVGLHEYWGNQGYGGQALRHRLAHSWTGANHPPFYITETGRDAVEGGNGGYIADGLSPAQFAAELQTYDGLVSQDSYVYGFTPFTCGPDNRFQFFNCDPLICPLFGGCNCDPNCCFQRTDCLACETAPDCTVTPSETAPSWLLGLAIGGLIGGLYLAIMTPRVGKKIVYYDQRTIPAGATVPPGFVIVKK